MHIHLFEFTDQKWCPAFLRQYMTDYLHFVITKAGIYKPAVSIIKDVIEKTGETDILDLCSGSGGGIDIVQSELSKLCGRTIKVTLSDKYPNIEPFELLKAKSKGGVDYLTESVDAMNVPAGIKGIRTMFSAFHHFRPDEAIEILKSAAFSKTPICIFEGAGKRVLDFMGILLLHSFIFLISTPFIRPFTFKRIFFTYFIPLVPVATIWDGLVSILRLYTPKDMIAMANETGMKNYAWKAAEIKGKFANVVMYLAGYPKE